VVAGYLWIRSLTGGHDAAKPARTASSWRLAPSLGDGYTGGAAAVRF
jgi:hypothetical protein